MKRKERSVSPIPYIVKTYEEGLKIPGKKFWSKNYPQPPPWSDVPIAIIEQKDMDGIRKYRKDLCYPKNGKEYSPEEYRAYKWFEERKRENKFTRERHGVWRQEIRIQPNRRRSELKNPTENTKTGAVKKIFNQKKPNTVAVNSQKNLQNPSTSNQAKSTRNEISSATDKSPILGVSHNLSKLNINDANQVHARSTSFRNSTRFKPSTASPSNSWTVSTIQSVQSSSEDSTTNDTQIGSNDESSPTLLQVPSISSNESSDSTSFKCPQTNESLDHQSYLERTLNSRNINPFAASLTQSLLKKINFMDHLKSIPTCTVRKAVGALKKNSEVVCGGESFKVMQLIGKGAFGTVYSGVCKTDSKVYALKQESHDNVWEYYICLEIQKRLKHESLATGFMSINHALIGLNRTILISDFFTYGTLINVCNNFKKATGRKLDEKIVMICTVQILDLIHYLHKECRIIHADIKADNFLVMGPIRFENDHVFIKLIDFGMAIDMKLLEAEKPDVQFSYPVQINQENEDVYVRDGKAWTYHIDLYGLAGVAHALLFTKYMKMEKQNGRWQIQEKFPRYFTKEVWEKFFTALLNFPDENRLPDLLQLKKMINFSLLENKKSLIQKVTEFNNSLASHY